MYDNFSRAAADEVDAGDICAVTGLPDVSIGETICSRSQPEPLPTITVRTDQDHLELHSSARTAGQLRHVGDLCLPWGSTRRRGARPRRGESFSQAWWANVGCI